MLRNLFGESFDRQTKMMRVQIDILISMQKDIHFIYQIVLIMVILSLLGILFIL